MPLRGGMAYHLSDPGTRRFKLRQTTVIVVSVAVVCAWQYLATERRPNALASLSVVLGMAVALWLTLRSTYWFLADEVQLDGSRLVARRGAQAAEVRPEQIVDVAPVPFSLRRAIVIRLSAPASPFGDRITFLPVGWRASDAQQADQFAMLLKQRLRDMQREEAAEA